MTVIYSALNAPAQRQHKTELSPLSVHASAFIGLAAAALLPAVFWVGLAALLAPFFGVTLSNYVLAFAGVAIAMFLAAVCAPIIFADHS
jgi:hypothetical protein